MTDNKKTFTIEGMHCSGCANLVRSILEEDVAGVKTAAVNLEQCEAEIVYDSDEFDQQKAAEILKESGYELIP